MEMTMQHTPPHPQPGMLSSLMRSGWPIWVVLALPALPMIYQLLAGEGLRGMVRESGEWAARFAIIALMLSPLMIAFPKVRVIRWLMHNRRHIGVAAFLYAVFHVGLVASRAGGLQAFAGGLLLPPTLSGWIAFVLFAILAATSNAWSMQHMGIWWKKVQRLTYAAALVFTLHWLAYERDGGVLFFHFGPLLVLEAYRLLWHLRVRARH
jgi:methionine sulfoxide reductase heme-binding subunit